MCEMILQDKSDTPTHAHLICWHKFSPSLEYMSDVVMLPDMYMSSVMTTHDVYSDMTSCYIYA